MHLLSYITYINTIHENVTLEYTVVNQVGAKEEKLYLISKLGIVMDHKSFLHSIHSLEEVRDPQDSSFNDLAVPSLEASSALLIIAFLTTSMFPLPYCSWGTEQLLV
jgi:hypothetical protein